MSSTVTAPAPVHPVASVPGPLPRFRCVALGVVWSAYLVVFLSRLCVGPLSPFLKQAFDLSNAQIGGLTSASAITYAPTLVLAGWLVDRIGVRRALVIGSLVTGVFVGASLWRRPTASCFSCWASVVWAAGSSIPPP